MNRSRWATIPLCGALALLTVLAVVSVVTTQRTRSPLAPAANAAAFNPANIISDQVFYYSGSMSAAQIQSFLTAKGASCVPASGGPACLKDYSMATQTEPANSFCKQQYTGAASETAAQIIAKVSAACGINPQVLIVTLQKETTMITRTAPTQHLYDRAMGYGCADSLNGACSAYYPGLFLQLYFAAQQFQRYAANPAKYGHVPGIANDIQYSVDPACGSSSVVIANQATASLYNYTPYQPTRAALAAGYGSTGNGCDQYGNRNFWLYFTDWFGTTQVINWPQSVAFVKALYTDVLHRTPSDGEVNSWAMQVALHPDHSWVPAQFLYSTEQLQVMVDGVYEAALKRHADADGLSNWVRYFQTGTTLNDLNAGIYGSQEALNALGGGDVSQWVDGMYLGLLGRHAAAEERVYWAGVAASQGRVTVSYAISTSVEARSRRVNGYYMSLLGRTADPTGVSTWVPMLLGRGDLDVQAMIINSQEYWGAASTRFPS